MWLANALLIKRKKDPSDLAATLAFRFVLSICSFVGWFHFIYAHVASFLPIIGIFSILFASIRCYRIANFNTYLVSLIHNSISFRCVYNRISFIFPILECFHPRLRFHVFCSKIHFAIDEKEMLMYEIGERKKQTHVFLQLQTNHFQGFLFSHFECAQWFIFIFCFYSHFFIRACSACSLFLLCNKCRQMTMSTSTQKKTKILDLNVSEFWTVGHLNLMIPTE